MGHLVLLGDSIFDNGRYVPDGPAVVEHLRVGLPAGWGATLVARDGACVEDIAGQAARMPGEATHLVVSVGGNDALGFSTVLGEQVGTVGEALVMMATMREGFRGAYREMLEWVVRLGKAVAVCTVYEAIPGLGKAELGALCFFNDVIVQEAVRARVAVIDLRVVCTEVSDFAAVSPIEPSMLGGKKIARAIVRALTEEGGDGARSVVYG